MGEEKLKLVTYCGLYCGLCSARGRIPRQAGTLKETMTKEGYDQWGKDYLPGFEGFWEFWAISAIRRRTVRDAVRAEVPPSAGFGNVLRSEGWTRARSVRNFPARR